MNRKEFLFIYESVNANANGDPLNENRPRIDEETGLQYVTMYRIKRTIRDYVKLLSVLFPNEDNKVLYTQQYKEKDGKMFLKTMEMILKDETNLSKEDILKRFVDIRMFGGIFGIKGSNMAFQGPIQISYGQSYHRVKEQEIQLSAVMPSGEGKTQGTLGKAFIVPYALIGTDGSINQYNAEKTLLSEEDVSLMFKSLWNGTKELKTTSKNQKSLFLSEIEFKDEFQHTCIGNLKDTVCLDTNKDDLEIRGTKDYALNVDSFIYKLNNLEFKINKVNILRDSSLRISYKGEVVDNIRDLLNSNIELDEQVV